MSTRVMDRVELLKAIKSGLAEDIYYAFSWLSSPQGDEYWRRKYNRGEILSRGDISFMKGLAGIREVVEYPEDGTWV